MLLILQVYRNWIRDKALELSVAWPNVCYPNVTPALLGKGTQTLGCGALELVGFDKVAGGTQAILIPICMVSCQTSQTFFPVIDRWFY